MDRTGTPNSPLMAAEYHFVTVWKIRGTAHEVAEVLGDPMGLARWWPSVYLDVRELAPGDPQTHIGRYIELLTKGWLPYTLRWRFKVTESRGDHGFSLVADGDFVGHRRMDVGAERRHRGCPVRLADHSRQTTAALRHARLQADLRRQPPLGDGTGRREPQARAAEAASEDRSRAAGGAGASRADLRQGTTVAKGPGTSLHGSR